jgi:hypothetical protein
VFSYQTVYMHISGSVVSPGQVYNFPVLQTIPTCLQSLLFHPLLLYLHVIVLYTLHFQPLCPPPFVEAPATALDTTHTSPAITLLYNC